MAEVSYDVLIIGGLRANKFWRERRPVRQEHSTSVLVRSGKLCMVVDPGWPADVMSSAVQYRSGIGPKDVTHVFLTHFDVAHAAGITAFPKADWWMFEEEITFAEAELDEEDKEGGKLLAKMKPAPESLTTGVDLFPTPGHSPGHSSLLVYSSLENVIIAGDAVLTREHLERGDIGDAPYDITPARRSMGDILEIADVVIPGHDNIFVRRG